MTLCGLNPAPAEVRERAGAMTFRIYMKGQWKERKDWFEKSLSSLRLASLVKGGKNCKK